MDVEACPIADLKLVRLKMHKDARGFFAERFNARAFAGAGLPSQFVQDNHSFSPPKVLRGLHYQHAPPQGKLVGVTRGRIFDVAVDVRPHSPDFGKHFSVELSGDNGLLLWVPAGFAHGFCVLGDAPADVFYKVDDYYNAEGEGGIRYDDPALGIEWPVKNPILSDRDRALPGFGDYKNNPVQWEAA